MGNYKIPHDFKDEKPEEIPDIGSDYNKPGSKRDVIFKKTNVIVESSGSKFSYLIFGIESTCEKFGIDYDKCLVLMYMEELGLFGNKIEIFKRSIRLFDYQRLGLIVADYSNNGKELFKLTSKALEILENIKKVLDEESKFVGNNRCTDLETEKKVKGVLSDYFDLREPL